MTREIKDLCESLDEIANVYEYELDSKAQKVLAIACKKLEDISDENESLKDKINKVEISAFDMNLYNKILNENRENSVEIEFQKSDEEYLEK